MQKTAGIAERLKYIAGSEPDAVALIAADQRHIDYRCLSGIVGEARGELSGCGVADGCRIAGAMSDGLANAVAFLAISDHAAFMPMNPDFSKEQFVYHFKLLRASHVLLEGRPSNTREQDRNQDNEHADACQNAAAAAAAWELGLPVIMLMLEYAEEGGRAAVSWQSTHRHDNESRGHLSGPMRKENGTDDEGCGASLVICTSGTTAAPKVIGLMRDQLLGSAEERIQAFELGHRDRCLLITPFYRSVTLNALLASLLAGGSAVCAGRLEPAGFLALVEETAPTWFMASPAVLRSIVDNAERSGGAYNGSSLRFLRSTGASLSEKLYDSLTEMFRIPVVVTYGSTETRMIASTYREPAGHKPGSVGLPLDRESVMIADAAGQPVVPGKIGEILVRGENVIEGYENSGYDAGSFFGNWFRTGDLGYFDDDGYLFLTGRLKEIINRGGEKISPYEVEQAILQHPAVVDAAVFAIPGLHDTEEPAAAVRLHAGRDLNILELRKFLNGKLVAYKMPVGLYIVDEIPVSGEGKIQRSMLYSQLSGMKLKMQRIGDRDASIDPKRSVRPADEIEKKLAGMWRKILGVRRFGSGDTFYDLGGDSLKAALLFAEIEETFGKRIPMKVLAENCTFLVMAEAIRRSEDRPSAHFLIPFEKDGSGAPLFIVHGARGEVTNYHRIAEAFRGRRPVLGLRLNKRWDKWKHPLTIGQIASAYTEEILAEYPSGPYNIAGYCVGGVIAYEMARQLSSRGAVIGSLILFDSIIAGSNRPKKKEATTMLGRAAAEFRELPPGGAARWLRWKVERRLNFIREQFAARIYKRLIGPDPLRVFDIIPVMQLLRIARRHYDFGRYAGEIHYLVPEDEIEIALPSIEKWKTIARAVHVKKIEGAHGTILAEEHSESFAAAIASCLDTINDQDDEVNR